MTAKEETRLFNFTLLVTGLGYFVDSFDAFLLNVIRMPSLKEMGLSGDDLTRAGVFILNCQVTGTLIGSLFWGIMGDRLGRKRALLGSILIYSIGQLLNAFVEDVNTYAAIRFIVGFGIAGEVGLGATLVAEIVRSTKRTFSLALFTALGLLGVVAASLSIEFVSWRTSCLIGGFGGLLVLFLRHRLFESPLFIALPKKDPHRGNFMDILADPQSLGKWLCCIFILAPNFFITGFLLTLAPEMAKAAGVEGPVKTNIALAFYFSFAVAGDLMGAWLSEKLQSRNIVIIFYLLANATLGAIYVRYTPHDVNSFYMLCAALGLFNLWAISTTAAVEQFSTQLRATVTTTSMNFARACLVPINLAFLGLKATHGVSNAAFIVGYVIFGLGYLAVFFLPDRFGRSLSKPAS